MALVLRFAEMDDGTVYENGTACKDRVLVQFVYDSEGCTISLGAADRKVTITADADKLFSYLMRVL